MGNGAGARGGSTGVIRFPSAAADARIALPDRPPVTIIVLTWNGIHHTRRCFDAIRANTLSPKCRILAADNGSTDGTVEYLKSQRFIGSSFNGTNLGFARGNNLAIARAGRESDVILLNNDTEVRQADWVERLQESAYSAPDIGVVGCRLVKPDGSLLHAGTYLPLDTFWGQQIGALEKNVNQFNRDRDVEGVVFACVYIKRKILDEIGLLDEDYFSYFEDTDYCFRVLEKGYRVVCCGSVTVLHHEHGSCTANQVKQEDMFLRAQKIFRNKWKNKLKSTRYHRRLGWHSIFNFETGYAISSRQLACALDRKGVQMAYRYVYGPGTPFPVPEPELSDSYMINVIRGRELKADRVQVVYGQGDVFQANFGKYKIGFTMLETDRIPKEWVRQANKMDEVWVPSAFNARTFSESGVRCPIHVMPLGVDPDYFNPRIEGYPLTDAYTFLSVFEWGERKSPELLLRAFNEEFHSDEPVALICKILNVDPGIDVYREIAALGLDPLGGRIHLSLNEVVPAHQLGALYRSANCFVLPTRGEGWGMPVIEAMACGLPVIATAWSAHCDFMNAENAYPLPIDGLVPAKAKCPYYAGANWAQPSYRHLRRLMRGVFENPEEGRAKGAKASSDVLQNWTWDHAASLIVDRIRGIDLTLSGSSPGSPH